MFTSSVWWSFSSEQEPRDRPCHQWELSGLERSLHKSDPIWKGENHSHCWYSLCKVCWYTERVSFRNSISYISKRKHVKQIFWRKNYSITGKPLLSRAYHHPPPLYSCQSLTFSIKRESLSVTSRTDLSYSMLMLTISKYNILGCTFWVVSKQ